ncbi:MAG: hypothetical protein ACT4OJ_15440 [Bacteroidota bacterium]
MISLLTGIRRASDCLPAVPMNMGLEQAMLPDAWKVTAVLKQLLNS